VTLDAVADSYAAADTPAATFGTATALYADASPLKVTYLKFDLSSLAGKTVTAATLRIRTTSNASSGSPGPQLIKVAPSTWDEATLTFDNRPTPGAQAGQLGATSANTAYDVTLTPSAVAVGGPFTLAIDPQNSDAFYINSRETATPPQLVLTVQ
jgi:hypothetical protein